MQITFNQVNAAKLGQFHHWSLGCRTLERNFFLVTLYSLAVRSDKSEPLKTVPNHSYSRFGRRKENRRDKSVCYFRSRARTIPTARSSSIKRRIRAEQTQRGIGGEKGKRDEYKEAWQQFFSRLDVLWAYRLFAESRGRMALGRHDIRLPRPLQTLPRSPEPFSVRLDKCTPSFVHSRTAHSALDPRRYLFGRAGLSSFLSLTESYYALFTWRKILWDYLLQID